MENIIKLLKEQNKMLEAQNKRLMDIIERFASKDTRVVVNSYNQPSAKSLDINANVGDDNEISTCGKSMK